MDATALDEALATARQSANVREAAAALRTRLAPLRVVVVDAADMRDETAAACDARHRLYLGTSDGHCWTVTTEPSRATALFIAACG